MKQEIKKFIKNLFLLSIPFIGLIILYVIEDPFKVIWHYNSYYVSGKPPIVTLNKDFVSTETFLNNNSKEKYDSFIFGNSCSIFYEVKVWENLIKSNHCFHFDASEENIYGIWKKLDLLDQRKVSLKNVLIILDCETLENTADSEGILFFKHPLFSHKSWLDFHLEFLSAFLNLHFFYAYLNYNLFNVIDKSILDDRPIHYNMKNNELSFPYFENMISLDKNEFYSLRKKIFFKRDTNQIYFPKIIQKKQITILNAINKILRNNNTNFKIVINPLYDQVKLNKNDLNFLYNLFGINNVFDYSGINNITRDMYNYYDPHHYRPFIAKQIMEEIYNN